MLKKAHPPRLHIGQSLLPANAALFDRLGLRPQIGRRKVHDLGALPGETLLSPR